MNLSVIIPTLNEAENIGRLLDFLQHYGGAKVREVWVVDGGSTDDTLSIAKTKGAKTLKSTTKSRAEQMNLGAQHALGEVLYFVHADTLPPQSFAEDIITALHAGAQMGCFRCRFDSPSWLLMCNAWFTRFNALACQGGDKTFFILAPIFAELGGYDEKYVIMEEYDFIQRARKKYPMPILPKNTIVSARKFQKNAYFKVQFANLLVFRLFKLGISPIKLKKIYKKIIN